MKKYVHKKSASKLLMIIGGSMFGVGQILSVITLVNIYGKAGECSEATSCSFGVEQVASKIAVVVGYVGIGLFLVGLTMLVIESAKKKKAEKS